jgi:hypothetical protein
MDFGMIFAALVAGHYLADYWVQTDHQAQHKGLTGDRSREGRWNAFKHAATYTLTVSGAVLGTAAATGASVNAWTVLALLALNGVTHYVIDRRWTLEWVARKIGKGGWIDNDKTALPHLDQAAHLAIFGPVALAISVLA